MDISKLSVGGNPPHDINVLIEIPRGGEPVKYEFDPETQALFVDRFLHTSMLYPGNYGFIPHTLSGDGDPCDVLVVGQIPVISGAVMRCRPIGVLIMQDEAGEDEKVIAVPVDDLSPYYTNIRSYTDLPELQCQQIMHFFTHYKDLEKGKWVKGAEWAGPEKASEIIMAGMERAKAK